MDIKKGKLQLENNVAYLLTQEGVKCFETEKIWSGYLSHFLGKTVFARKLLQLDYDTGRPIILLWPAEIRPDHPSFELYYNERLPRYFGSLFGHIAINIKGTVFNFARMINEYEMLTEEEYFYRPALGEFGPGNKGRYNVSDPQKPHYDKFGRRFMRTVHALRVEGIDAEKLLLIFRQIFGERQKYFAAHPDLINDPRFNFFSNSCVTPIRNGLFQFGLQKIPGIAPRDFYANCLRSFSELAKGKNLKISTFTLPQLKVSEAPFSRPAQLLDPRNLFSESA
ncbi:MAG: hypothetical protein Q8N81_01830 [bacterium]|nr:hypothetical protein [bacterium]